MTITVTDLAHELNVNHAGLHAKIKALGIRTARRVTEQRRHRTLTDADATRIRRSYAEITHDAEDWVTAEQAARMTGFATADAFLRARSLGRITVERRQRVGPGVRGRAVRYNPADLVRIAAARPIRPHTPPRGTVSSPALAALAGVGRTTLARWAAQGCPHGLLVVGYRYWRPDEVLGWLERAPLHPRTTASSRATRAAQIERLRSHLAQATPQRSAG